MDTQEATTTASKEPTQCELILAALQQAAGGWVSMFDLYQASDSLNVHSRIYELRSVHGHDIENHQETLPGTHRRHSFYRLILPTPETETIATPQ